MSENIVWHQHQITRKMREELKGHRGVTLWFTGLSGAGKSTLANEVAAQLHELSCHTYVLDGDNIRLGLNAGLSFSAEDRKENIRRISEVAKLFTDSGTITLTAFISPFREDRQQARELHHGEDFLEIYVKADLAVCESRDPKGLYKKARSGEIKNFTGIDQPYEEPNAPDLVVDTGVDSLEACAQQVIDLLLERHIITEEPSE